MRGGRVSVFYIPRRMTAPGNSVLSSRATVNRRRDGCGEPSLPGHHRRYAAVRFFFPMLLRNFFLRLFPRRPAASSNSAHDLPIHRLGFGAMRVTGEGIWGPPKNHAEAIRVLRRTVENRHQLHRHRRFLRPARQRGTSLPRRLLPVPGRAGHRHQGWTAPHRPRPMAHRWPPGAPQGSLRGKSPKRLKLDRIDLYQFHRPDPKVSFEGLGRRDGGTPTGRKDSATSA